MAYTISWKRNINEKTVDILIGSIPIQLKQMSFGFCVSTTIKIAQSIITDKDL